MKNPCTDMKQFRIKVFTEQFIRSRWKLDGDGHVWDIRIYPNRQTPTGEWWVTLELVILSNTFRFSSVRATLACRLVDPQGTIRPSEEKSETGLVRRMNDSITLMLMDRRDLANSIYLKDGTLTVQCTISVHKEVEAPVAAKEVCIPSSNLLQHLINLLHSGTGADVTFDVSGDSFPAHKSILAARSPVFMAEFFGEMKEKSSQDIEIEEMEAATFKTMLHFIYTDMVPELDEQKESATVMAQHLLVAADRYGLDRLKLICEAKLSTTTSINVDTAATSLAIAEQHHCPQLKAKCFDFILSTPEILDAVLETEGYKYLEASCPSVLTELLKSSRGVKKLKRG